MRGEVERCSLPRLARVVRLRAGIAPASAHLYNVHMKRITASEARKHWFRILDEVAGGQVVVVERNGRRIVLRRESARPSRRAAVDYRAVLSVPRVSEADQWSWRWNASGNLRAAKPRQK